MALNIKDEAVHRNARRLATLTGQSITDVVRDAIAAKLREAERRQADAANGRNAEALLEAAAACKATLRLGGHAADHASLYGDDGLPA